MWKTAFQPGLHCVWGKPQEPCMALGSNCTGDNLLPISSAVLVAGAWGTRLGPSFRVAHWLRCCPLGGCRGAELWALSLAGQKLKEVALRGNSLSSLCLSFCSCWKSGSVDTLLLNMLLSNRGQSRSGRTLVVLAVAWEYGPLLGAAQGGILPL